MAAVGPMLPGQGRLTTSDALSYLRNVKVKFADRKDIYDTFLEIMKEFKAQRYVASKLGIWIFEIFEQRVLSCHGS